MNTHPAPKQGCKSMEKTQIERILRKPFRHVGLVEKHTQTLWVYENEQMVHRPVTYVPGLYNIFDQILVNAATNKQRDPSMDSLNIEINAEQKLISVYNNGAGFPVEIHEREEVYIPEIIFGRLEKAKIDCDEDVKNMTGTKGYGVKLTNIFSTQFIIEIADGKRLRKYRQVFTNNARDRSEPVVTKCGKKANWTKVTFNPDLSKFSMTELDEDVVALMTKRVFDIAGCLGESVKVKLNGTQVPVKSFNDYVDLYLGASNLSRFRITQRVNNKWEVCVSLNDQQFQQVSFVNSISTRIGGTHVDYVTNQITGYIVKSNKKNKSADVTTDDVKNHLWVFVNALIDNPSFESRKKEKLNLPRKYFGSKCELSQDILEKVAKSGVVEKAKQSKEIMKSDETKARRVHVEKLEDANEAGGKESHKCTLILTEGDSAKSLALAGLSVVGRDYYGVFPICGKLLNVRDASTKKITKNKEIQNLIKILGLKEDKIYENVNPLRYGSVMIMTDQDLDGSHIKGLLLNFFHYFWPSLLKVPSFLFEFITPILKATHEDGSKMSFYSWPEYEDWKRTLSSANEWTTKYYPGLGASTSAEAQEYFVNIDANKRQFVWEGEEDGESIELAFSKNKIGARKKLLSSFRRGNHLGPAQRTTITHRDFVNKELMSYSMEDVERSIPSIADGLKTSQRKILFCAFKTNLNKEIKVDRFSGRVADHSAYHHGEQNLANTIIGMAHDYVGSNNLNLFQPCGQFGTRVKGGKDAAKARYIFTMLSPVTRVLFHKDDDVLLDYMNEDGQFIQPFWYIPIIPIVLVNGCKGVGTGWSTYIPKYNPRDIIANLKRLLNGESVLDMDPFYRGFKGIIRKILTPDGEQSYTSEGVYAFDDETKIQITELPIGKWTDDYMNFLNNLVKNGFIEEPKNSSTVDSVDISITLTEKGKDAAKKKGILKMFSLIATIKTTNMHLLDQSGRIQKYETPEQVLADFYHLRLKYYKKRKVRILEKRKRKELKLNNKLRFVDAVLNNEIILNGRKKADVVRELRQRKYEALPKKAKLVEGAVAGATDASEEDFDYLLNMEKNNTLTPEKHAELREEMTKMKSDAKIKSKTLWLEDLTSLEAQLDKLDKLDAIAEARRRELKEKLLQRDAA